MQRQSVRRGDIQARLGIETTMHRGLANQIQPAAGSVWLEPDHNFPGIAGIQVSPADAVDAASVAGLPSASRDGAGAMALTYPGAASGRAGPMSPVGGASKRALDIAVALAGLVAVLPLCLLVWAAIRCTSKGSPVFVQQRVGLGGKMFPCFKFRTMAPNADSILQDYLAKEAHAADEWRQTQKLMKDPRVTRLGRVLRKTSIDELPQLINVLRGEMSCVGPRPILPEELKRYGRHLDSYLSTRPGLTGMWQVSGRGKTSYEERVALDHCYVSDWSLLLDLKILMKTIVVLARIDETA
jgi:exopolysaccharide production protein ExoY